MNATVKKYATAVNDLLPESVRPYREGRLHPTVKKYATAVGNLIPAYLRPDRSAEGRTQQTTASTTPPQS